MTTEKPDRCLVARQANRRARWVRNKRAERARHAPPPPLPPDPLIEKAIWAERDRRFASYPSYLWSYQDWGQGTGRGSFAFQCDVWAVKTLLKLQSPEEPVSAGQIARWMKEHGKSHGYKPGSLRTMVWRALAAIVILESAPSRAEVSSVWPPFTYLPELDCGPETVGD